MPPSKARTRSRTKEDEVASLWPRGVPRDPTEALLAMGGGWRGSFGGNESDLAEWLFDRRMVFRADVPGGDRALVERLRAKAPASPDPERRLTEKNLRFFSGCIVGTGRFELKLSALWSQDHGFSPLGRFRIPGGAPVIDVNANFLRVVAACVGGWDTVTWDGVGWLTKDAVAFWKGGALVGCAAGIAANGPVLVPNIPPDRLIAGEAPQHQVALHPAWAEQPVKTDVWGEESSERALEDVARALGGVRSVRGIIRWAVPTRAGRLWLGLERGSAGSVVALFEEPLRLLRLPLAAWPPGAERTLLFSTPRACWRWLWASGLPVDPARQVAGLRGPPVEGYGTAFSRTVLEEQARIFDTAAGEFLPGAFPAFPDPRPDVWRTPEALAQRASRARYLRQEVGR